MEERAAEHLIVEATVVTSVPFVRTFSGCALPRPLFCSVLGPDPGPGSDIDLTAMPTLT